MISVEKKFYRKYVTLFVVLFVCSHHATANYAFAETLSQQIPQGVYHYLEKDGEKEIPFNWKAEETGDGIAITVKEHGKTFYNR